MSVHFNETLLQLGAPAAVFGAALMGSGHCGAMCGPWVFAARLRSHGSRIAFHSARLTAYSAGGALAGGLGASLLSDPILGAGEALAALFAISLAMTLIARPVLQWLSPRLLKRVSAVRPTRNGELLRSASLGMATALLPCGWLHLFVGVSAATGSAARGAILMFVFGLGTIPSLALSSELLRRLNRTAALKQGPVLASVFLAIALAASLTLKIGPLLRNPAAPHSADVVCH